MKTDTAWASDVKVSMPVPIDRTEILLDMGDRAFTANGMFINISQADAEALGRPTFAPAQES